MKKDFLELAKVLVNDPFQGISLGNNCFKIRLSIKSKGQGKRGGARVITYLCLEDNIVYLLSIYDKSDQSTISDKEIAELLKTIK